MIAARPNSVNIKLPLHLTKRGTPWIGRGSRDAPHNEGPSAILDAPTNGRRPGSLTSCRAAPSQEPSTMQFEKYWPARGKKGRNLKRINFPLSRKRRGTVSLEMHLKIIFGLRASQLQEELFFFNSNRRGCCSCSLVPGIFAINFESSGEKSPPIG